MDTLAGIVIALLLSVMSIIVAQTSIANLHQASREREAKIIVMHTGGLSHKATITKRDIY